MNHAKDISAGDHKSLAFLDTLLADKRIVLLGESSHGTEEYSEAKFRLIQYLHQKLGFNVLLFESPITPGCFFNIVKDAAPARELLRHTIQGIWHTATVLKLFEYLKENKMYFGGFDPQFIPSPYPALLFAHAFKNDPATRKELLSLESSITEAFQNGKAYARLNDSFSLAYAALAKKLDTLQLSSLQQYVRHIITSNISYYANLHKGNTRDSCMAKNVIWLAENVYPHEKIIVWAHNSHINKNTNSPARFMGKLLAGHFQQQLYAIGLYMINGHTALNNRTIIPVDNPQKGSLEDVLSVPGYTTTFIATNDESFNRQIVTLHWGKDRQKLNVYKSYDAVILINGVQPPEYVKD